MLSSAAPGRAASYARRIAKSIETLAALPPADDPLEAAWRRLAEERGNAFVSPEWFRAWAAHYGHRVEARVVVARDGEGRPVSVLPLVQQGKTLRFAGANLGDSFEPAGGALAAALPRGWRTLVLDNVETGAPWCRALIAAQPGRLASVRLRDASLPRAALPTSFDDFLAARSRNFRSQVRRRLGSLERDPHAVFRRTERPEELEADLEAFLRLHEARWDERGGSRMLGQRARAFHRDFAAAALAHGWLRLWLLEVDGHAVAAWYGWRLGEVYSYYQAGFDPAWGRRSVGLALLAHTVRAAIEEGAATYDLLLGGEHYKARFADSERRVETLLVTPALHPRRLVAAAEATARRGVRRLPPGTRSRIRRVAGGLVDRLPTGRVR